MIARVRRDAGMVAFALCAASWTMLGAQDARAVKRASPDALPSVVLSAPLDRLLRDYESAWRRGDAAALAELFADDGFVLQSGQAPVRGRAAIRAAYAGQGGSPLKLRALAASVTDTVGYIIGGYRYGDATEDLGKFTLTLRRARGGPWRIFSDMDNENGRRREL